MMMQSLAAIRSELLRLKWDIAASRFQTALRRHALVLEQNGFNPNQPRVPAGRSDGGQWTSGGSGGGGVSIRFPLATGDGAGFDTLNEEGAFEDFYGTDDYGYDWLVDFGDLADFDGGDSANFSAAKRRAKPGEPGHNIQEFEDIPEERPPSAKERNIIARQVSDNPFLATYLLASPGILAQHWLNEKYWEIRADQDPARTLQELQAAKFSPDKRGYDDHHVVGQAARGPDFDASRINDSSNIVRIPRYKHWKINSWYETPNDLYGGLSPRMYLIGKTWEEHRRTGLNALRKFGVLQP